MSLLTQRALRVFAVIEDYRAGSGDILEALLPFFEPFLADRAGQYLDPVEFANAVNSAYKWTLTSDIIEEFLRRFAARGWVKEQALADQAAVYLICHQGSESSLSGEVVAQAEKTLSAIAVEFKQFVEEISPLTAVSHTTDELAELLIEWLVSIDAYTEDVLRQHVLKATNEDGKIGITTSLPDDSRLTSEDKYLCARFIKALYQQNSPFIPSLCRIASVGLLTEVIQDFRKPVTKIKKTDLNVYLDAPVALDLLGVSGRAATDNLRPIIKQLQSIGANIRIFRTSVRELQKALQAVLNRQPTERTGPTAEAIRRNEVIEAYVRQVAQDPDSALSRQGVQIVERKLGQFPNEHEFFTQSQYESLFQKTNWHLDVQPREHDASVIAFILRMRRGISKTDLFGTKHVLVTRNPLLVNLSRRFCRDNELIKATDVGPAVHQRQLATAVWLRTGLGETIDEVPKRYVLAACERVLELKKSVIDKVRNEARNLTPEKANQLELLLTEDRSVQVLMDKTLNASHVVGPSNIESLVDTMRRSLVANIEEDALRKIAEAKKDADSKVRRAHSSKRQIEKKLEASEGALKAAVNEDERVISAFLGYINNRIKKRRSNIRITVALATLIISLLPLATDALTGWQKLLLSSIGSLFAGFFLLKQFWDKPTGLAHMLEKRDHELLQKLACERGLESKLRKFSIQYTNHRFEIITPDSTEVLEGMLQNIL